MSAFDFTCLLTFISRLLFNFKYFRFELFSYDFILFFSSWCVSSVGMLFTMQTKNPGLQHGGMFEDVYFSHVDSGAIQKKSYHRDHENEFVWPLSSGGRQWKCSRMNQTCSVSNNLLYFC